MLALLFAAVTVSGAPTEAVTEQPLCDQTSCRGVIRLGSNVNACEGISSYCFAKPAGLSATCSDVFEGSEPPCYHLVYPDVPPGSIIGEIPEEVRMVGKPHPATRNLGSAVMVFGYIGVVNHPFELVWDL